MKGVFSEKVNRKLENDWFLKFLFLHREFFIGEFSYYAKRRKPYKDFFHCLSSAQEILPRNHSVH